MLFNSVDFALFLPIVFILYWFIISKNLKLQNSLIVIASYFFYGWWDWRFLSLIFVSTTVDYIVGLGLLKQISPTKRKALLLTSLLVNIGFLGFFKYYNFFLDNFITAFTFFGNEIKANTLNIILPVGISFYTFQTLSYSIDIYRRKLEPTRDFIAFAAFVSFFPQLVAGPIERAKNLLPQFYRKRTFDYNKAADGIRQILWGFFKKLVIADNCAKVVNEVFSNYQDLSGSTLLVAVVFFAFQIYGDFSGYSDIAIGTARLFGFNIMRNFAFPYFSRDIAEFWRRWHISLTTWFRDYVYIPLGGSRGSNWIKIRNTFIVFIVSGFWHGANWTFIIWGVLNAIYFLPFLLLNQNRKHVDIAAKNRIFPTIKEIMQMTYTFFITLIAWVFFRAEDLKHAFLYLQTMFSKSLFIRPSDYPKKIMVFIIILLLFEWFNRNKEHALQMDTFIIPRFYRWTIYFFIIFIILIFGEFNKTEFIYFAF